IRVERQLVPMNAGLREGPPKGGKRRIEAIGSAGVRILMAYQAVQRKRFGEMWTPTPTSWLISEDGGTTPMRAKAVTEQIARLGRREGIDARPHDFRRFSVSQLQAENVDPLTIRDRHGHASIETTELYMLRVNPSDMEAAEVMGR